MIKEELFIQEQAEKAKNIKKEMDKKGLPDLKGTEKQIAWSENIRKDILDELNQIYSDDTKRIDRIKVLRDRYNILYEEEFGKIKKVKKSDYI